MLLFSISESSTSRRFYKNLSLFHRQRKVVLPALSLTRITRATRAKQCRHGVFHRTPSPCHFCRRAVRLVHATCSKKAFRDSGNPFGTTKLNLFNGGKVQLNFKKSMRYWPWHVQFSVVIQYDSPSTYAWRRFRFPRRIGRFEVGWLLLITNPFLFGTATDILPPKKKDCVEE